MRRSGTAGLILDTSAVVAVLNDEAHRAQFEEIIADSTCEMSSVSLLEASILLLSKRVEGSLAARDTWIEEAGVSVVPFIPTQVRLARNAYARFRKGRHPASLNFGDCATYALAIETGDELLFTGEDFPLTHVRCAETGTSTTK
jgi:ribonuclease VapC